MTRLAQFVASLLALSTLVLASGGPQSRSAEELVEFLVGKDRIWQEQIPRTFRFREWAEGPIGPSTMEGIVHGDKFRIRRVRLPEGAAREGAFTRPGRHRTTLISSGERYLIVQTVAGAGPGEEKVVRPWIATLSNELGDPDLPLSMLMEMRSPFLGQDLTGFLRSHPVVDVEESGDSIRVCFASSEEAALTVQAGKADQIGGFLGHVITFERSCAWRPTLIQFIEDDGDLERSSGPGPLERVRFGKLTGVVVRSFEWSGWKDVAGTPLPSSREHRLFGRIEAGQIVGQSFRWASDLEVQALDDVPSGVSFELAPPPSAGPLGQINDLDSGEVIVHDLRGTDALVEDREELLNLFSDSTAEENTPAQALPLREWARRILFLAGACLLGFAALRVLRSKQAEDET